MASQINAPSTWQLQFVSMHIRASVRTYRRRVSVSLQQHSDKLIKTGCWKIADHLSAEHVP